MCQKFFEDAYITKKGAIMQKDNHKKASRRSWNRVESIFEGHRSKSNTG